MAQKIDENTRGTPGFQGSETSSTEVMIYTHAGDPIVTEGGKLIPFSGRRKEDASPILTQVSTSKALGEPSGTFQITAKVPRLTNDTVGLFDKIIDDDWVDVVMTRHARKWHVMRGLVDDVRRVRGVSGSGATTTTYEIIGRDFGKVWEQSPVWFSPQAKENIWGHLAAKVFTAKAGLEGSGAISDSLKLDSPAAAVRGYLFGFLEELEGLGRANWLPPKDMPGINADSFVKSLFLEISKFSGIPDRTTVDPNFITMSGNLWDLARQWSDPMFCELFVDLMAQTTTGGVDFLKQGDEMPVRQSKMAVIFRDRPFPMVGGLIEQNKNYDSEWFNLPLFIIPEQAITNYNVGRSGLERFNAYFVQSLMHPEESPASGFDMQAPLWDKEDIFRHGLRRFDVQSKYKARDTNLTGLTKQQREMIRDWYSINPYLLSGTIDLGRGMPDIRVGTRGRIPGRAGPEQDETYYVEQVSHNWMLQQGIRTSLGVTRGWRGTDEALMENLEKLADRYEVELSATAGG